MNFIFIIIDYVYRMDLYSWMLINRPTRIYSHRLILLILLLAFLLGFPHSCSHVLPLIPSAPLPNLDHTINKPALSFIIASMNDKLGGEQGNRYKIILVGDVSVGKTALVWRYTEGEFLSNKGTLVTVVDFKMKPITLHGQPVKLYIWDTAGSEKYRSIVNTYFKGCQGVVMVFDLSRQGSFKNIAECWYPLAKTKTSDAIFVLVGNKCDLDVRVPKDEIERWCEQNKVHYLQVSVKTNKNVEEVFNWLTHRIYDAENTVIKSKSFALDAKSPNPHQKERKCCKS